MYDQETMEAERWTVMAERWTVMRVRACELNEGDRIMVNAVDAVVRKVEKYEGTPDRQLHLQGHAGIKVLDNEPILLVILAAAPTPLEPEPIEARFLAAWDRLTTAGPTDEQIELAARAILKADVLRPRTDSGLGGLRPMTFKELNEPERVAYRDTARAVLTAALTSTQESSNG